ncbi:hypothetical protein KC19_4G249800 [Ceratodon purpureus]|uniref:Endoglucanase n=1 Tax=Ceratodon purpureus TaxID=3225 RepID=A0A8T0IES7_CERPU|nr:hypothetical protein KC19_4G249800 [Ceratodon purpureus]KAG0581418.1 hypothetical protein KC19_4G249800 [Ceratodon purpureus]KAG0581419.1 hypothetical protein KC19_4G249800 [Ceratodon purpureus]
MYNKKWSRGNSMEMSRQLGYSMRSTEYDDDDFSDLGRSMRTDVGRSMRTEHHIGRSMRLTDEPPLSRELDETQQSWLLEPNNKKKQPRVNLGFGASCTRRCFLWSICIFLTCAIIVALSLVTWKFAPKKHRTLSAPDNYTIALGKALTFFDIQKSGNLASDGKNDILWRGASARSDGQAAQNGSAAVNLTGGFYDAGDNIKFGFPGAYAITLLSWSVIEYRAKFVATGELDHAKSLIKWGTDYMLKTFNASGVDKIYCQVGLGGGAKPNDHYCWERPEDLDHFHDTRRSAIAVTSGSDLAGEMAAALSAASIVFKDQPGYSLKLVRGAKALYAFAKFRPAPFADGLPSSERAFYNSSHFNDELIWGSTWLYLATGNLTYLGDATIRATDNSNRRGGNPFGVFDWDNKLAGAQLLLTRLRMLQGPGYPYEQVLKQYNNETNLAMCAYLPQFKTFNRTAGGLILLNPNATQHLPAAVDAAFLATLYADYLTAADIPVLECGPYWFSTDVLRNFSKTQVNYALGKNPLNMSYVVGYSDKFPLQPHHRAASFPSDSKSYSCEQGWHWRDRNSPNPHVLEGAMVRGPDILDRFTDTRSNANQNEPTLASNAGLVGALIALSTAKSSKENVDVNGIFAGIPAYVYPPPPPVTPWTP